MSIVGASSKKANKPSSSKKSLLIIGGIFAAVLLLSFWYYQSQRPNYRDLEKEFVSLNIPSDWAAINSSSNKGTLGLFCWQIEGETCPYLNNKFLSKNNIEASAQKKASQEVLGSAYSFTGLFNEMACEDPKLSCGYVFSKGSVQAVMSYKTVNEPEGQQIDISLGKKE